MWPDFVLGFSLIVIAGVIFKVHLRLKRFRDIE